MRNYRALIRYASLLLLIFTGAIFLITWMRRQKKSVVYPDASTFIIEPGVDAFVTRDKYGDFRLFWAIQSDTTIIYTGTDPHQIDTESPIVVTSDENQVILRKLDLSVRHYFMLLFIGGLHDGKHIIVAEREIPLAGAVNFRDIGGYRTLDGYAVRWSRAYRAGQLVNLTETDIFQLENIGIRITCDLRTEEEAEEAPDKLPEKVHYIAVPVNSSESRSKQIRSLMRYRGKMDVAMIDAYTRIMIDKNPIVFGEIFKLLADESNLPLIFHCTAGKDRAGITAALLLAFLGVPDDIIIADYSLSNHHTDVFRSIGKKAIKPLLRIGIQESSLEPLFTANPVTIAATLDYVREHYGSVEGYLGSAAGLSDSTLNRVRENMLDKDL